MRQQKDGALLGAIEESDLARMLEGIGRWKPFPVYSDRAAWQALPAAQRESLMAAGEQRLTYNWPTLKASLQLEFVRNGNRSRFEALYFERRAALNELIIAECLEGCGRFLDQIMDGIWAVCEESSWSVPAHLKMQRGGAGLPNTSDPEIDLFAADTGALLAWTCYLLRAPLDTVSPALVPRMEREIQHRIITPFIERDDFWWMGLTRKRKINNWNPWILSNILPLLFLCESDQQRCVRAVHKALRCLDRFIEDCSDDGGCDEGPMYWKVAGGSLFRVLEWLRHATSGQIDIYHVPKIRNLGAFIYKVQVAGRYFLNFADAGPLLVPPPEVCFGFGRRTRDARLMALGRWAHSATDAALTADHRNLGGQLYCLFDCEWIAGDAQPPLPRDVYLPDTQVFVARDRAGDPGGFFIGAKGGHNNEGHNHNDVGQVIVYLDARPVLVDAGVGTYAAKTFGPDRYDIWTMQSAWHSLPTVNGHTQLAGHRFAAQEVRWQADDRQAVFVLDLARAYPEAARIKTWTRHLALHRGQQVELVDTYELDACSGPTVMHLLTACDIRETGSGFLQLASRQLGPERFSGEAVLAYDADLYELTVDVKDLVDEKLKQQWGDRLHRVRFVPRQPTCAGEWRICLSRPG